MPPIEKYIDGGWWGILLVAVVLLASYKLWQYARSKSSKQSQPVEDNQNEIQGKDGNSDPASQPKQDPPKKADAPAAATPAPDKGKKGITVRWGCIGWLIMACAIFALAWVSGMFNTYPVTRVRTTTSITQDLKDGAAYVHSNVKKFYRSNAPLIANTFGNVDIQPDEFDDSSVSECPQATMSDQYCITSERKLVRRADGLQGTLSFCWRWDRVDPKAELHAFGKQIRGPREEIVSLISTKSYDHLDLEPSGMVKLTYRMCEASSE